MEALLSCKSEINYKIVALAIVEQKSDEEAAQNKLHEFLKEKGLDTECVVKCGNIAKYNTELCKSYGCLHYFIEQSGH